MTSLSFQTPLAKALALVFALSMLGCLVVNAQREATGGSTSDPVSEPAGSEDQAAPVEADAQTLELGPVGYVQPEGAAYISSSKSLAPGDLAKMLGTTEEAGEPQPESTTYLPTSKSLPPGELAKLLGAIEEPSVEPAPETFLLGSKSGVLTESTDLEKWIKDGAEAPAPKKPDDAKEESKSNTYLRSSKSAVLIELPEPIEETKATVEPTSEKKSGTAKAKDKPKR